MTTIQSWYPPRHDSPAKSVVGPMVAPVIPQGLYPDPNAWKVKKFEHHGNRRFVTRIGLNLHRNSQTTWDEVAVDEQHGLVIANAAYTPPSMANVARSVDLEREIAINVDPFEGNGPLGLRLFPAFGEVVDVNAVQGRVYVRLLEAPFSCLLSLPLYTKNEVGTITGVGLLRQKGQFFEGRATLTAKDQSEFRLGNIRVIEQEKPESFDDAIRDLAEPTAKFRF